jgi:flavin reductase (DIM6/NTAB) family NADH-FMN oxidoreductase RutF
MEALRRLGAVAGAGEDEFSAVGLHRQRHNEAWIA